MKHIFLIALACITGIAPVLAQKELPPVGGKAKDFKLSEKKVQTYANGLKSTLVPYGQLPKATISLVIKTGNIHEGPNQVWLADLTGRLLREGTATMNFAALAKKAAMMGGSINVSVGSTQTTIAGSVLSEYAPDFI
jgi:predicted Zn-dependent peptidase